MLFLSFTNKILTRVASEGYSSPSFIFANIYFTLRGMRCAFTPKKRRKVWALHFGGPSQSSDRRLSPATSSKKRRFPKGNRYFFVINVLKTSGSASGSTPDPPTDPQRERCGNQRSHISVVYSKRRRTVTPLPRGGKPFTCVIIRSRDF